MERLIRKNIIDLDLLQSLVDTRRLEIYAGNCQPCRVDYWIERGNHYTIQIIFCSPSETYYYVGFCLYGQPIIKEISYQEAKIYSERIVWGYVGTSFKIKILFKQDEIRVQVKNALQKTDFYTIECDHMINRLFQNGENQDMQTHVKIDNNYGYLFTYERGKFLYKYRTDDQEEVVYYVLYVVMREWIHKNNDAYFKEKEFMKKAFQQIQGLYWVWFQHGKICLSMEVR